MSRHARHPSACAGGRPSVSAAGLALLLIAGPAGGVASFTDVTTSAGVSYLQHAAQMDPDCIFGPLCEPERLTGGAAVGDVDGDGHPDLFVTRLDAPDLLFRNQGNGTFQDTSAASGLDAFDLQSNGAAFADLENDGDLDLFVTSLAESADATNGRNHLFVNDGSGSFTEAAVLRGVDAATTGRRSVFSVSVGDYDRDGWIDFHVNEWAAFGTTNSRLLRNRGVSAPGFFEDTTDTAGVGLAGVFAFASSFVDLDGDGWQDLAVAADFGTSRLFWNDGDGSFSDGTSTSGVGTDENGMGSTFGDYDADGDLDWFVTSVHDPAETCETESCNWGYTGNRLYRNLGSRSFDDATDAAGVRAGYWGWGSVFFDYDNDGDLDLVMTNGVDFPGISTDDPFNADPMRLWENDGSGGMSEVSGATGLTDTGPGKGLLVFDYDSDGDLDLFVVNNASLPRLYRNDGGNDNDWLRIGLVGRRSNRDALGARVILRATPTSDEQHRTIGTASHFLGQSEHTAHFGLGAAAGPVYQVEIHWPSGLSETLENVLPNQHLVVQESLPVPTQPFWAAAVLLAGLLASLLLPGNRRCRLRARERSEHRPGAPPAHR